MDDSFKTVEGTLPWSDRTEWLLPAADKNTIDWPFTHGPVDVERALKAMRPHLKGMRTCIQAGGCIGIWPIRLAQVFEHVITFEPEPVNYECLSHNTADVTNLSRYRAALGQDKHRIRMGLEPRYIGHCGAWQVMPDGDIPVVRIDDMGLDDVDLIYLDIEGSEHPALMGGLETIRRCRPVIGLEVKGFSRRYNNGASPLELLMNEGYQMQANIGSDVLLTC